MKKGLPDVQNLTDGRGIRIPKVGVRNVEASFWYSSKEDLYHCVGNYSMYASLQEDTKGTNMSRFVEALSEQLEERTVFESAFGFMDKLSARIKEKTQADEGYAKVRFKYLENRKSPVTHLTAQQAVKCEMESACVGEGLYRRKLTVHVPYTSLCACSKAMSSKGAHSQRSEASITILCDRDMHWQIVPKIIEEVNNAASCPVYPLLKREDEKYVTDKAYESPKFVEDVVRDLGNVFERYVEDKTGLIDYCIVCNHFESIHSSDAVAIVYAGRELK